MGLGGLHCIGLHLNFAMTKGPKMKVLFQITSKETGKVVIRRRKIAKALRWWLRERGIVYDYTYFLI
jgi:hypothetical protein